MRKITLKIAVAVFTFILGIIGAGLWFVYPLSLNQALNDVPVDAVVTEEADEYAVYSTVISEVYLKDSQLPKRLLISSHTSFYLDSPAHEKQQLAASLKEAFSAVNEESFTDYQAKHEYSSKLQPGFNIPVRYSLVKNSLLGNEGIRLSRVGFDRDRNHALVSIDFPCPDLCGKGNFVTLEKVDGVWTIQEVSSQIHDSSAVEGTVY